MIQVSQNKLNNIYINLRGLPDRIIENSQVEWSSHEFGWVVGRVQQNWENLVFIYIIEYRH